MGTLELQHEVAAQIVLNLSIKCTMIQMGTLHNLAGAEIPSQFCQSPPIKLDTYENSPRFRPIIVLYLCFREKLANRADACVQTLAWDQTS